MFRRAQQQDDGSRARWPSAVQVQPWRPGSRAAGPTPTSAPEAGGQPAPEPVREQEPTAAVTAVEDERYERLAARAATAIRRMRRLKEQVEQLTAELAEVTAERDRLREQRVIDLDAAPVPRRVRP